MSLRLAPRLFGSIAVVATALAALGCGGYSPPEDPRNTRDPMDIVRAHLRALEAGDWAAADALIADSYTMKMQGMPFFISIDKAHALDVHKAREQAFPDYTFNEKMEKVGVNGVKLTVTWSGTHTGFLDYPVGDVPKMKATGKKIALPAEYFTYYVEGDQIVYTYGEIPEGHGPPALKKQLGVE